MRVWVIADLLNDDAQKIIWQLCHLHLKAHNIMLLTDLVANNDIFHQLICKHNDFVMHNRILWIMRLRLSLNHEWNSMIAVNVTLCCVVDVNIDWFVSSIFFRTRISMLLSHSWIFDHHRSNNFDNVMFFSLVNRIELIQRR